jgi:hypothetical protein
VLVVDEEGTVEALRAMPLLLRINRMNTTEMHLPKMPPLAPRCWRHQEEEPVRSGQDNLMTQSCGEEQDDDSILEFLLSHYPNRWNKTRLFPFQQAAAGDGASLNTIFTLLQMQPTLVEAKLSRCESL